MKERLYIGHALDEQDDADIERRQRVQVIDLSEILERRHIRRRRRRIILALWMLTIVGAAVLGYHVGVGRMSCTNDGKALAEMLLGTRPDGGEGMMFECLNDVLYETGTIVEMIGIGRADYRDDDPASDDYKRPFIRATAGEGVNDWWYFRSVDLRPLTSEACAAYAELVCAEIRYLFQSTIQIRRSK